MNSIPYLWSARSGILLGSVFLILTPVANAHSPRPGACDLFAEQDIRQIMAVPEATPIEQKQLVMDNTENCSYRWPATVQATLHHDGQTLSVVLTNTVTINLTVPGQQSSQELLAARVEAQGDAVPVMEQAAPGTAPRYWSSQYQQLSTLREGQLLQIHVDRYDDRRNRFYALSLLQHLGQ